MLRNFYNKVMFSVTDKFGFSDANVDIFLRLFIIVVRGTNVIFLGADEPSASPRIGHAVQQQHRPRRA